MSFDILRLLIVFGAFQGFILGLILITTKRFQRMSNYFLAALLFNLSILNGTSMAELTLPRGDYPAIGYIPSFFVLCIPPVIYFFVKYLIEPSYRFRKVDFLFFIPAIWEFGHRFFRYIHFLLYGPKDAATNDHFYFISNIYESIAVLAAIGVIIYCIRLLNDYERSLYDNYAEVEGKSLNWLRITLISGVALSATWLVVTISDFRPEYFLFDLTMLLLLGLSVLIYWIGYSMIIRQELLETPIFAISVKNNKTSESSDLSIKTEDHYRRILDIMEGEQLYRDPNLNMSVLSEKTGLSNGYLSQIINAKRGENFFDFVNSYRVYDVQQKMINPEYSHYTILGIAQDAGFKSKSTFNAVFKKMTGKTPSEYKKSNGPIKVRPD